jgi:hypothetical protein
MVETGTPAAAAVAIKGELRHSQDRPACFPDASIHLACFIGKYTKVGYLLDKIIRVGFSVIARNSEQYQESYADRARDLITHANSCFAYPLN